MEEGARRITDANYLNSTQGTFSCGMNLVEGCDWWRKGVLPLLDNQTLGVRERREERRKKSQAQAKRGIKIDDRS